MSIKQKRGHCIDCGKLIWLPFERCKSCASKKAWTEKRRLQHSKKMKGRKFTEDHKEKIRRALKTSEKAQKHREKVLKYLHTPEIQAKRIKTMRTPKLRRKMKEWGLKHKSDQKWINTISELLTGDKNPSWRGGLSQKGYSSGFTETLKGEIRERDNCTCQLCYNTEDEVGYTLTIHHIDYSKSNHDRMNLVSLCKRCNSLVNFGRDEWMEILRGNDST